MSLSDHNKELARIKQYTFKQSVFKEHFGKNTSRIYLEETFKQLPCFYATALTDFGDDVTQSTSVTTTVTSTNNEIKTIITPASGNYSAGTMTSFTFENTMINLNSNIHISSSGTDSEKLIFSTSVYADGSVKINIYNTDQSSNITADGIKIYVTILNLINHNFSVTSEGSSGGSNPYSTIAFLTSSESAVGLRLSTPNITAGEISVFPSREDNQSLWNSTFFSSQKELEWECAVKLEQTNNCSLLAGLKSSSNLRHILDTSSSDSHAFFIYANEASPGASLTTLPSTTNWMFVYYNGSNQIKTDLGLAVDNSTIYRLRIVFTTDKKIRVYINDVQYGLSTASGTTTVTDNTSESTVITDAAVDLSSAYSIS